MTNQNKIYTLLVLAILILISFYYFNFYVEKEVVYINNENIQDSSTEQNNLPEGASNFEERGYVVSENPGYPMGKLFLLYEKPGAPALRVELLINEKSKCTFGEQTIVCLALSAPIQMSLKDKIVLVEGEIVGEQVVVSKIEYKE